MGRLFVLGAEGHRFALCVAEPRVGQELLGRVLPQQTVQIVQGTVGRSDVYALAAHGGLVREAAGEPVPGDLVDVRQDVEVDARHSA